MKPLRFVGTAQADLAAFPVEAKRAAGFELWNVQNGLMPSDFKPLLTVGQGAYEIRIHLQEAWRVIYVARFAGAVYVLHAFCKTSRKTPLDAIDLAKRRYRQIEKES